MIVHCDKLLWGVILLIVWARSPGVALAEKVVEEKGGFSYSLPDGWRSEEFAGADFRVAIGPAHDGFRPNVNIAKGTRAGMSLGFNVRLYLATAKKRHPEFNLLKMAPALTADFQPSVVVVFEHKEGDKLLRFTLAFIDGIGDERYLLTFTTLPNRTKELEATITTFIQSFTLLQNREPHLDLTK